jgi:hypothetical protein
MTDAMSLRENEQPRAHSQRKLSLREKQRRRRERERNRRQRRMQLSQLCLPDDGVLTFAEWCCLNDISTRTGRRIRASGKGPVFLQLSENRVGVRVRDNRLWQD